MNLVSKSCLLNVFTDVIKTWSQEESGLVSEVGRDDLCDHVEIAVVTEAERDGSRLCE